MLCLRAKSKSSRARASCCDKSLDAWWVSVSDSLVYWLLESGSLNQKREKGPKKSIKIKKLSVFIGSKKWQGKKKNGRGEKQEQSEKEKKMGRRDKTNSQLNVGWILFILAETQDFLSFYFLLNVGG